MSRMNRRIFVGALAAGAAALAGTRVAKAQTGGLRVRKNASKLPANDPVFTDYALAVRRMHELPEADRRSWRRQAMIHADDCHQAGRSFLPWHRHYINQFELICGQLIGKPEFALPYWDWSHGVGAIPEPFYADPNLDVVALNDDGDYAGGQFPVDTAAVRGLPSGRGLQETLSGGAFVVQTIDSILGESSYGIFVNRLERTPHNTAHGIVGGPGGHMGDFMSPLDPIFWLHHCNVDRLWAQWQLAGNVSPALGETYANDFCDADGNPVTVGSADALAFDALGYTYEDFGGAPQPLLAAAGLIANPIDDGGFTEASRIAAAAFEATPPKSLGKNSNVPAANLAVETRIPIQVSNLSEEISGRTRTLEWSLPPAAALQSNALDERALSQFGRPKTIQRRILAKLTGVSRTFARDPFVNVFVNCPYLTEFTPYTDVHYAGTFAFFGDASHGDGGGHAHQGGGVFYVDLTPALRGIDLSNLDEIDVQLMPLMPAGDGGDGKIEVKSVEILSV